VALCVKQPETLQAEQWAEQFTLAVWWAAPVEIRSAFARLQRSGHLQPAAKIYALEHLQAIRQSWREIHPSSGLRDQASALLDLYSIRAADSLQLAAALVWCRNRPNGRTFLCADLRLSEAAMQAGFNVLQP
jgi:predicted nucleic acid-binding protein